MSKPIAWLMESPQAIWFERAEPVDQPDDVKVMPLVAMEQPEPLTDKEIKRMAAEWFLSMYWPLCNKFARAIEAAHGIKGEA